MSTTAERASLPYDLSAAARAVYEQPVVGHVIDGEVRESASGESFPVYDPSTGLEFARGAQGGSAEVEAAVLSARRAFVDGRWRLMPPAQKERVLHRYAELIAENRTAFGELDSIDAGILKGFGGFIADFAVGAIDYYAGWPTKLKGVVPAVPADLSVALVREPVGVVGIITPWNGPTAVAAFVAAALAAGNSVILKPAEQTPLSAHLLGVLALRAGVPAGVFNVVQGAGEVGGALVAHPGVDKISFTGSVATGKAIAEAGAKTLKRVSLELGGKSPILVFPDADLDLAAAGAMSAIWNNSGQVCTAGSRTLVHRSVYDRFAEKVVAESAKLQVGGAFEEGTELGPLVSAAQLARVQSYVEIGQAEGAELALSPTASGGGGYFHGPTVFTGVRNDMRIAQEEIFGPVMALLPFDTEEEAYAIANDVEFGLSAGVWTNDLSRAHRASRALHVGTVWINTYQNNDVSVPYGGVKQSGYGRTLGEESLEAFLHTKSVWTKVFDA
ncbi:MAG: betaine-aldehyde dehydrogenase [Frankiales bacterium]|nr:betaine-aldehyde dehydrogenase [Frankiales bacterium]MCW2586366.1 betaine-aldehyde dehydrogenase [Frankiales bacterium]